MKMKSLVIIAFLMVMSGCYARLQRVIIDERLNPAKVSGYERIAIMLSDDGSYTFVRLDHQARAVPGDMKTKDKTKVYLGSGIIVANKVQAVLLNLFPQVDRVDTRDKEKAVDWCVQHDVKFLVIPTILHWEDRNTPWSGMADKVELKIELLDVGRTEIINTVLLEAHNEWGTLTDKPPEDLLDDKLTEAVASMFAPVN